MLGFRLGVSGQRSKGLGNRRDSGCCGFRARGLILLGGGAKPPFELWPFHSVRAKLEFAEFGLVDFALFRSLSRLFRQSFWRSWGLGGEQTWGQRETQTYGSGSGWGRGAGGGCRRGCTQNLKGS